ncbi:g8133 [Coccomyxa elongata]
MSPFNSSRCPLCRSSFGHFPDVCNVLHHFLLRAFPEQYESRAEETRENEQEEEVDSVEVSPPAAVSENVQAQSVAARDARWSLADFLCSRPDCAALLRDPAILNCGCAMCISCLPEAGEPCPRCGAISVTQPKPCTKLKELVEELFPSKVFQWRPSRTDASAVQNVAVLAEAACQRAKRKTMDIAGCVEEPTSAAAASEQSEGEEAADQPSEEQEPSTPQTPAAAIQSRLHSNVTHFGIGCDFCGQYPIVGKRYQCLDCPERVGFDLCKACYERRSNVHGRFNQHHTSEHRMREVAVTPNILHILQAANPDMDMSQILNMMQMAWEADDPPIPHVHRGGPRPATADPFAPGNLAAAAILAHGQLLDTAAAVPPALDGDARQPDGFATAEAASAPQPHSAEQPGSAEEGPAQASASGVAAQGHVQVGPDGMLTVIVPVLATGSEASDAAESAHAETISFAEEAPASAAHPEAGTETERAPEG